MTLRKIALITLAVALCLPLAAAAEPGSFGKHHRGPGRGLLPPPGYLDLTEEQIEAVQALRETVREEMQAEREQTRALRDELRTALEAASPDATQVGELVIQLHTKKDALRATFSDVESQLTALLAPEQLEKWENFKELRETRRERRRGFGERFRQEPDTF